MSLAFRDNTEVYRPMGAPRASLFFYALNAAHHDLIRALELSVGLDVCYDDIYEQAEQLKEQCNEILGMVWQRMHRLEYK